MLFIKFKILDLSKYTAFQNLYEYMVYTRHPNFEFKAAEAIPLHWDKLTNEERKSSLEKLEESDRYKLLIPDYANQFLATYFGFDQKRAGIFGYEKSSLLNYLECSFEVDMDKLEKLNGHTGIVEFSTGNYPFGGMERFLMTLKAFGLEPIESFNGFSIITIKWLSKFEYETIELEEETKRYLKEKRG